MSKADETPAVQNPVYVIVPSRTAWWPVRFTVPAADDPGAVISQVIEMKFQFIDDEALSKIAQRADELDQADSSPAGDADLVRAEIYMGIVKDWRGVASGEGVLLPFSADNFAALLRSLPGFASRCILPAYGACLRGEGEIRTGN